MYKRPERAEHVDGWMFSVAQSEEVRVQKTYRSQNNNDDYNDKHQDLRSENDFHQLQVRAEIYWWSWKGLTHHMEPRCRDVEMGQQPLLLLLLLSVTHLCKSLLRSPRSVWLYKLSPLSLFSQWRLETWTQLVLFQLASRSSSWGRMMVEVGSRKHLVWIWWLTYLELTLYDEVITLSRGQFCLLGVCMCV